MSSGPQRSARTSGSYRGTWWEVVEIVEEDAGKRYKVRWAGKDPKTGQPWPLDWVPNSHCSSDLIQDWEKKKGETPYNFIPRIHSYDGIMQRRNTNPILLQHQPLRPE